MTRRFSGDHRDDLMDYDPERLVDDDFEMARLKSQAIVNAQPKRPLDGGRLGDLVDIPGLAPGQVPVFVPIVEINGNHEDAQLYTIVLFATSGLVIPASNMFAVARVEFGTANLQAVADVDIPVSSNVLQPGPATPLRMQGGVCFTLMGSYVRVSVMNDSLENIRLGAAIAYGPIGTPKPPTRTIRFVIPGAGVIGFPIPPFAQTFQVLRSPSVAITVDQVDWGGTIVDSFMVAAGVPAPVEHSVHPQAFTINVTAAVGTVVSIVYKLAL